MDSASETAPLTGCAAAYKPEPPAVAFLKQISLSLSRPICVCRAFWLTTKDNWVCVITPFPKNDLILVNDNIKMHKTPQNRLGVFVP